MDTNSGKERRKFERFETDVKVQFFVSFDIKTKVEFRIADKEGQQVSSQKYSAVSRNVSAEGLAFQSEKVLNPGDRLVLDVYVPASKEPIPMEGEVRWCQMNPSSLGGKKAEVYETGVKILKVENTDVTSSIVIDKAHNVVWSIVLESVFGNFKNLMLERKQI